VLLSVSKRFLVVAAALLATGAGGARAALPSIYVKYKTETCTFSLTTDAGKAVRTILPGTYQVVVATDGTYGDYFVSDQTGLRACMGFVGFRLTGPGVNLFTTLEDGDASGDTLNAKFKAGATYTFQDDHNVAGTRKSFTVAKTGSAAAVGPVQFRGGLTALVSSTGTVTLQRNNEPISSVQEGEWTIVVRDQSKTSGLSIQQLNKSPVAVTTAAYRGSKQVDVILKPGRWFFYSPGGKKTAFRVVA
jgi:hypothetical protein